MKKSKLNLMVITAIAICIGFVLPAGAQNTSVVKNGWYIGGMLVNNGMSGDFDDSTEYYYVTNYDVTIYNVPDVDSGTGFELVLGSRMNQFSFEVGYQKTNHDVSSVYEDVGNDASYSVIDFDFKFDVFSKSQLRPYILLGLGFSWVDLEDNAVNSNSLELEDETFKGYCWNLGTGLSYYLNPQLAITGGFKYRYNTFGKVEDIDLDDDLKTKVLSTSVGLLFTF